MKKYLMMGAAALIMGGTFMSCSKEKDLYDPTFDVKSFLSKYQEAFISVYGQPAADQTWGFGSPAESRVTRSQSAPFVGDITQPYDETWVAEYNQTAKEPNSENVADNYDHSIYHEPVASVWVKTKDAVPGTPDTYPVGWWDWNVVNACRNNSESADYQWLDTNVGWDKVGNISDQATWDALIAKATTDGMLKFFAVQKGTEGTPEEGYWTEGQEGYWEYDQTYVTNFKITGEYNGTIGVAASEGIIDGSTLSGAERTIVVTGTWNINGDQRIGSLGKIIIANGGIVNVQSGVMLNMVNQARLVVLPGGKLTGEGTVEVNNGNAEGLENYNGGTIDVKVFNNNFGKFYNYGKFLVEEYQAGAVESNIYNHSLVVINKTGMNSESPNARIFNACQFYVKDSMRARNYEGVGGSALIVNNTLFLSGSEDGTTIASYVGLAAGALVQCGQLYNNNTSWTGPTSGYAVLDIEDKISFINWTQDHPETAGYFENNIYVYAGTWTNVPQGNGKQQADPSDTENYAQSIADYKFWTTVANCRGNGGVKKVEKGNVEVIPADSDFNLGEAGCTPGFKIKEDEDPIDPPTPPTPDPTTLTIRILAEDLSASEATDFDFNDVVFDVTANFGEANSVNQVDITVYAAGGTLPLKINSVDGAGGFEVHEEFGIQDKKTMINTHAHFARDPYKWDDNRESYTKTITPVDENGNAVAINKSTFLSDVNNYVRVEVQKTIEGRSVWCLLEAKRGVPACKLAVPVGTPWALERTNMNDAFTSFKNWVQYNNPTEWYKVKKAANVYNEGENTVCAHEGK